MAEVTFNEGWRASASKTASDYATAYNATTGTVYQNPSGLLCEHQAVFPGGSYLRFNIYRTFLYWNTSVLPDDAIISNVDLQIYVANKWAARTYNIVVQNGQPNFPNKPAITSDYLRSRYSGNGGQIASDDITVDAWNTITFNTDGRNWINKEGWTKLVLRIDREINGDAPVTPSEGGDNAEGVQIYFHPEEMVYTKLIITFTSISVQNVRAENNPTFARTILFGNITGEFVITERGFEYLIQDTEPSAEDTGIEIKETKESGFEAGEYSLKNKTLYDQQYIADNIVWWFRSYCKDDAENRYIAESWMKNLPNIITLDMTNINYNKADGNGLIISEGASELSRRGFEVKHEYSGSYMDSWKFEIAGFEGELENKTTEGAGGVIIDFYWAGDLVKTVLETAGLALGAFVITIGEMLFGWPVMDDCLIDGKAYKCRAFADNEFGRVYGEDIDFSTPTRTYFSENPPTIGELTIVKNEIIENLPVGITASRRGFRYGTTETADEFDVHENGSFTNGPYSMMLVDLLPDTTYYIYAYIVVEGIVYEGTLETITTDPEDTEDSDEYPTPHYSPHGQDYREIETKVFAEVLASIGIIEFSGGKKTLPIVNHLIQTNSDAKTIADNYLNRFKLAKTRMTVTFPTPLPFEREDTVDFSYGALLFKEDDKGVVHFKEDGAGVSVLMDKISMIIKKINSVGLDKTETSVDYTAVLDLEHE